MNASERRYERGCKALLLVGAVIHWAAAALLIDEVWPPAYVSNFAALPEILAAVLPRL